MPTAAPAGWRRRLPSFWPRAHTAIASLMMQQPRQLRQMRSSVLEDPHHAPGGHGQQPGRAGRQRCPHSWEVPLTASRRSAGSATLWSPSSGVSPMRPQLSVTAVTFPPVPSRSARYHAGEVAP
jgi:hypothetical protein